jgi:hypothetical protein
MLQYNTHVILFEKLKAYKMNWVSVYFEITFPSSNLNFDSVIWIKLCLALFRFMFPRIFVLLYATSPL